LRLESLPVCLVSAAAASTSARAAAAVATTAFAPLLASAASRGSPAPALVLPRGAAHCGARGGEESLPVQRGREVCASGRRGARGGGGRNLPVQQGKDVSTCGRGGGARRGGHGAARRDGRGFARRVGRDFSSCLAFLASAVRRPSPFAVGPLSL